MLKIFRHIRFNLIEANKSGRYIKYAIGEIVLVVVGILIALQINNWNEDNKSLDFQAKILEEIKYSMSMDLKRTKAILEGRAKPKAMAISNVIEIIKRDSLVADSILRRNFFTAGLTLSFYYDKGAFESLKSRGFENIRSDELRSQIIRFYEVSLPLDVIFVDYNRDLNNQRRQALRDKLMGHFYAKEDSIWRVRYTIEIDNLINNSDFDKLMELEQKMADNYIRRLDDIIEGYEYMIALIEKNLNN